MKQVFSSGGSHTCSICKVGIQDDEKRLGFIEPYTSDFGGETETSYHKSCYDKSITATVYESGLKAGRAEVSPQEAKPSEENITEFIENAMIASVIQGKELQFESLGNGKFRVAGSVGVPLEKAEKESVADSPVSEPPAENTEEKGWEIKAGRKYKVVLNKDNGEIEDVSEPEESEVEEIEELEVHHPEGWPIVSDSVVPVAEKVNELVRVLNKHIKNGN